LYDYQIEELKSVYGEDMEYFHIGKKIANVQEVIVMAEGFDVIAGVFPIEMTEGILKLLKKEKQFIRSNGHWEATGNKIVNFNLGSVKDETKYVHDFFEEVLSVELITEKIENKIMGVKNILWVSSERELNEDQIKELKSIYGESININRFDKRISSAKELIDNIEQNDVLAVILPPNIISELVTLTDKPVIRSKSIRIVTGNKIVNPISLKEEIEHEFSHGYWELVKKVEIKTNKLLGVAK